MSVTAYIEFRLTTGFLIAQAAKGREWGPHADYHDLVVNKSGKDEVIIPADYCKKFSTDERNHSQNRPSLDN